MYCVIGELPAAQGWRPIEIATSSARAIAGAARTARPVPEAARKLRREIVFMVIGLPPGCAPRFGASSWSGSLGDGGGVGVAPDELPDLVGQHLKFGRGAYGVAPRS